MKRNHKWVTSTFRTFILLTILMASQVGLSKKIGDIRVYFNHGVDTTYAIDDKNFARENVNLEKVLFQAIEKAKDQVLVAVYTQNLLRVAELLVAKRKTGVDVRVILDGEVVDGAGEPATNSTTADNKKYIEILRNGNVPIRFLGDRSYLMHNKFLVIDSRSDVRAISFTGSTNWTESGIHGDPFAKEGAVARTEGDVNDLLAIEGTEPTKAFEEEFERLWKEGGSRRSPVYHLKADGKEMFILFFPDGNEGEPCDFLIRFFRDHNQKSALFSQFVFSSLELAEPFIRKLKNVNQYEMSGVFDRSFSTQYYSEALEFLGIHAINPKTGNPRPGGGRLAPTEVPSYIKDQIRHGGLTYQRNSKMFGDVHHQKVAILDGIHLVTGSLNFSKNGCTRNNENAVIFVNNRAIANQYEQAFYYRYHKARPVWNDVRRAK